MNVDLIHKPSRDNMVPDVQSRREEFQTMNTIQTLHLIYKDERNLQLKKKRRYVKNLKVQRLLGELCKGNV